MKKESSVSSAGPFEGRVRGWDAHGVYQERVNPTKTTQGGQSKLVERMYAWTHQTNKVGDGTTHARGERRGTGAGGGGVQGIAWTRARLNAPAWFT